MPRRSSLRSNRRRSSVRRRRDEPTQRRSRSDASDESEDTSGNEAETEEAPLKAAFEKIWSAVRTCKDMRGRVVSRLFWDLPDEDEYPDYFEEIKNPVSLNMIKQRIDDDEYSKLETFRDDMDTMFENAKTYNAEGSQIYNDAVYMQNLARKLFAGESTIKEEDGTPRDHEEEKLEALPEIVHHSDIYHVGDYVHVENPRNRSKPHVAHIFKLWRNSRGEEGVHVCWYYRPEQTVHSATRTFFENEVFKTNSFNDYSMSSVLGRCFVITVREAQKGRPRGSEGKMVYVCDTRYNESSKSFARIKNWPGVMPEGVTSKIEMEYYDTPIALKRVPTPLAEEAAEVVKQVAASRQRQREVSGPKVPGVKSGSRSVSSRVSTPVPSRRRNSVQSQGSVGTPMTINESVATPSAVDSPLVGSPMPAPRTTLPLQTAPQQLQLPEYQQSYPTPYAPSYPQGYQNYPTPTVSRQVNFSVDGQTHAYVTYGSTQAQSSTYQGAQPNLPPETARQFACNEQGHMLWFPTPPLDVVRPPQPQHSEVYMQRRLAVRAKMKRQREEYYARELEPKRIWSSYLPEWRTESVKPMLLPYEVFELHPHMEGAVTNGLYDLADALTSDAMNLQQVVRPEPDNNAVGLQSAKP